MDALAKESSDRTCCCGKERQGVGEFGESDSKRLPAEPKTCFGGVRTCVVIVCVGCGMCT